MGVLQRIALCYLAASLIIRYFTHYGSIIVGFVLLAGYWGLLYVFGDPGHELDMSGNAITRLDLFLLGEGHVYKRDVIPFDPEGILSTIPAIVNVLAGYWVGRFVQKSGTTHARLLQLMVGGAVLLAFSLWWNLVFPISKKLWTSSFTLHTVGIDILVACVLMYAIEIRKWTTGIFFFNIFGKNSLVIYLLSELLLITLSLITVSGGQSVFEWISINVFQAVFPGSFGSLVTAIAFMMLCWVIGWALDRKHIYIKI
jgi:predicted acyltransferase